MNQHLQSILNIIQQDERLSVDEKNAISKSLKDADKELEITAFKLDRTEKVKRTTAILLEETIEELEQKRKAVEEQNRELEIETSLERVRTVALSMNKADDMLDVCKIISHQLELLAVKEIRNVQTAIFYKEKGTYMNYEYYLKHDKTFITETTYNNNEKHAAFAEKMQKGNGEFFVLNLYGNEVKDWISYQKTTNVFIDDFLYNASSLNYYWFSLGSVALGISTYEPLKEKDTHLFKRFVNVFELAYRRYLDIEQAEAQAREATIEAALERVRSKAMAMQKSDDLANAVAIVFDELDKLNIGILRCGIGIINKENRSVNVWTTTRSDQDAPVQVSGDESMDHHPLLQGAYNAWLKQEDYSYLLQGADLTDYYKSLTFGNFRLPDSQSIITEKEGLRHYYFLATFQAGGLFAFGETPFSDEAKKVMKRFADVFNLTYTRFNDIKKAEAQAREAIKTSSLDRVRAEIASMRTTSDLEKITPLIWNELTILDVPFIRCGVFIMDEVQEQIHTFLSTPDGKAIAAFNLPYNTPGTTTNVLKHWRKKETYKDYWDEAAFTEWTKNLVEKGVIPSSEKYSTEHSITNLYLHFLPFLQGMLYVGSDVSLSDDDLQLVQTLANAFSTAYARYEDFNKLEAAKVQIENTLVNLKQAQTQLVQSEKMAFLGELTAGIAHEIQNPLNFVNNFSEVSNELLDEMMEEVAKGNYKEVKAIADDVKQNLEKINHHGKRADVIVKGMLQHCRSSSAIKEPTNINKLADEYLRLAYHGLRAKDKSFNATLETNYDESLEKINIIPQDIGRVILNLIINAFYVVAEKKKENSNGYEPTVSISTKKIGDKVLISVKDNGNGISPKVLDKIFQPFFTTKPTGQGTGLGLSLSYDIIKAHGGEFEVESKEGKYAEFKVILPA